MKIENQKNKINKKIKLITIDGDGCAFAYTKIESKFESSWDALGFAYNLKKNWDERTKKFYKFNSDFENDKKWAEEDVTDLENKEVVLAEKVLYPIPYSKGFEDFIRDSNSKLIRGLLTASFDLVAKKIQKDLNLDFCYCNFLHRANGNFSGTLDYLVGTWEKNKKIPEICDLFGVYPEEICHVGDNENDLSVAENVGLFIAFNPKKENVANKAKYVIYDFMELNKILLK